MVSAIGNDGPLYGYANIAITAARRLTGFIVCINRDEQKSLSLVSLLLQCCG